MDADTGLIRKTARDQFDKLILQPLENIPSGARKVLAMVVIIDALDECDQDKYIRLIINLFSCMKGLQFPQLQVLITGRPELPIRLSFNAVKDASEEVVQHEIPPNVIEHDIAAFLKHEFATIKIEYNSSVSGDRQLPPDWPGVWNVQRLVDMAIPLFIFAATICCFLADWKCGNPNKKLEDTLSFQEEGQGLQLDATYLPILNKLVDCLSTKQRGEVIKQFRLVVGSIVTLWTPLSRTALGRLLNISNDTVDDQLDLLHSGPQYPIGPVSSSATTSLFPRLLSRCRKRETNLFWIG
ncbi:hypothetical protein B0J13DRAFT_620779 [Dactylonectria estremocensis]|uniref:Nephrocystin 3-like N-terminal domain-containing protein n=1 Tax=Dactylonectria estremocensis TaxID=1079267 RepID=A0A9P9F3M7_9HYPO|nr:hypothetical protein B0J13DRAFT_620779 [Dactylonectria estremocensis]